MPKTLLCVLAWVLAAPSLFSQSIVRTIHGTQAAQQFGAWVDSVADTDGDGIADYVIGAPGDDSAGPGFGAAFLYSGASGALLHAVHGVAPTGPIGYYPFGGRVLGLDDVDGDGRGDFIVVANEINRNGVVRAYSGASGAKLWEIDGSAHALGLIDGEVAYVGDVNGDAIADFIIGSSLEGGSMQGATYVVSGLDGAILHSFSDGPPGAGVGASVAGLDDADMDGVPEFAFTYLNGPGPAFVEVFSGASAHLLGYWLGSSAFGFRIAGVGDVDGDGRGDLAIGTVGYPDHGGRVGAYSLAHGELWEVAGPCDSCPGCSGPAYGSAFGLYLTRLGDVDHDGLDDVGVTGRLFDCTVLSGHDGSAIGDMRQSSEVTVASAGFNEPTVIIRPLPDVNGDHQPDFLVGAPLDSTEGLAGAGRVQIFSSASKTAVGTKLGFGNGSGTPCPCGNDAQGQAGCANSTSLGARLAAFGSTSVSLDDLWFEGNHFPGGASSLLITGTSALNGGLGVQVGDGLLICGGATKRVRTSTACTNGYASWGNGLRSLGLWNAGETRYFQSWYRDPNGPCHSTFNFTNAVAVTFTP